MAHSTFTIKDFSKELATVTIPMAPLTVLSLPNYAAAMTALRNGIAGISTGIIQKERFIQDETFISRDKPANQWAQREFKLLVTYEGNTSHKLYSLTIPCANVAMTLKDDSDEVDLTDADASAFVTAFNAHARTPDAAAENVTVLSLRVVGRNL